MVDGLLHQAVLLVEQAEVRVGCLDMAALLERTLAGERQLDRRTDSQATHYKSSQALQAAQLQQSTAQLRFMQSLQQRQDELQRTLLYSMMRTAAD